jgi:hypothetical protein
MLRSARLRQYHRVKPPVTIPYLDAAAVRASVQHHQSSLYRFRRFVRINDLWRRGLAVPGCEVAVVGGHPCPSAKTKKRLLCPRSAITSLININVAERHRRPRPR